MKTIILKIKIFAIFAALALLVSCDKDEGSPFPEKQTTRTMFIYLASDNTLWGYGEENINEILSAATITNIGMGKVLIFYDRPDEAPSLIEIIAGKERGTSKTLKTYEDINVADGKVFAMAVEDMKRYAAAPSYYLILWSHGTGWLPGNLPSGRSRYDAAETKTRAGSQTIDKQYGREQFSVAEDRGRFMDQEDFTENLPDGLFDVVVFDECYAGGIELAWLMRNKAKYIITSPAEVAAAGMPYAKILPHVFQPNILKSAAAISEIYFKNYTSATTALWDCSKIDDELMEMFKQIVTNAGRDKVYSVNLDKIQYYNRGLGSYRRVILEVGDFVKEITDESDPLREIFLNKLKAIVLQRGVTSSLFGEIHGIEFDRYSGITTYIPTSRYVNLNSEYKNTTWYKTAYPEGFIP